ncbi:RNI-like protein [Pilatotrama ljubarskyi]|nr:RNI-like protein [Pilatotrama ljubarskyi]
MLSPSASSSAVTIPTPGKSILKRPPPPQPSFFARITKILPTQNQQPDATKDDGSTLKRAHFILPEMTTVYPIMATNPPSTPSLKEEKRSIEEREAERRRRIVRGNPSNPEGNAEDDWWSMDKVEAFYRECCTGREEAPDPAISAAFKRAASTNPRTVDFSGIQLNAGTAAVLSDVFTIEWGLRKLVFKECDLDEHILKPILHALLIPGTLTFLSVSSNRRLKAPAFRLIGAYLTKAKSLQFLDLSQNALDKKAIEYIAAALPAAPTPGLVSLRLDDCSLKPQALDALAHSVRVSSLRNISLRHNRISATGAVAIALMIKDYPDRFPATASDGGSVPSSPVTSTASLASTLSPPATPSSPSQPLPSHSSGSGTSTPPQRPGPILPPPRHPATLPQTTYTPYIPRSRRGPSAGAPAPVHTNPLSPAGRPIPIITTSAQGGVTARLPPPPAHPSQSNGHPRGIETSLRQGPSAALLEQVRALDNLPRLGALRTLDLKGNDIRTGITYIAQVLKRNRTLKVLNLSENKLDVQGLVAIAEALKYNSCLETLDLSKNPCCGPGLEGIQSLRTAFTLNAALKRLFLSSTNMTSAGAIALAEFLPESASLLHLDLTMNNLDLAGVMALSSGLKSNHVMRCLDLNIPPGDEEMARMCRDILESCIRNTEEAERASMGGTPNGYSGRGEAKGVWGMIEQSELAKSIREDDKKKVDEQHDVSLSPSRNPTDIPSAAQTESDVVIQARSRKSELEDLLAQSPSSSSAPAAPVLDRDSELVKSTREIMKSIIAMIETTTEPSRLEMLLSLNDDLTDLLARLEPRPEPLKIQGLGLQIGHGKIMSNGHAQHVESSRAGAEEPEPSDDDEPITPRVDKGKGRAEPEPEPQESVLSPTFLITESDEEEGDTATIPTEGGESVVSPTDLSRRLVEEEGEVFRKGAVLLGPEEMEGEYDGEELRKELLEAMVERPPPRLVEEFAPEGAAPERDQNSSAATSPPESKKPPPRPYIRRSRSSSSAVTVDTQNTSSPIERSLSGGFTPTSSSASPISPGGSRASILSRTSSSSSLREAAEPVPGLSA